MSQILSKIVLDKLINKIIKWEHLIKIIKLIRTQISLKISYREKVLDNKIYYKMIENLKNKMINIKCVNRNRIGRSKIKIKNSAWISTTYFWSIL